MTQQLPDELTEIRYVSAGDSSVAYQTFGSGPNLVANRPRSTSSLHRGRRIRAGDEHSREYSD